MGIEACTNDDMLVAFTHWYYMTLRLLNHEKEALDALETIHSGMNIIENMAYHQLCLFYKGEISLEELTGDQFSNIMNDAAAYGIGNWFFYNNKQEKAREIYNSIFKGNGWASFGNIAAEADYARNFNH